MKTVVLVGCGKSKRGRAAPAKELYTGPLFLKARAYAERIGNEWGILSAKHGLLMPDEKVEPYDLCLEDLDREELQAWVWRTRFQIVDRWPGRKWTEKGYVRLSGERFVCLAGTLYARAFGDPGELTVEFPLKGLGIGRRLRFLSDAVEGSP